MPIGVPSRASAALESHEIATQVRIRIKEELNWVADVMAPVEPYLGVPAR